MTATTMKELYNHLGAVGISRKFARNVLPSWWDDEIAKEPSGFQQAQMYLSRAFNLELNSLSVAQKSPQFFVTEHKFKLNRNVSEGQVSASAHYATAMARLALSATKTAYTALPEDPKTLRAKILESQLCVNLGGLLTYCTGAGIPVIHIEHMPGTKMAGVAIRLEGRYAIVLSKKAHPAYLLFHLAHEIGHIAKHHLAKDGFLADQKIGEGNRDDDADEKEADAYAIRLLNGVEIKYTAEPGAIRSGKKLFEAASHKATKVNVDVGHIILNYGHAQGNFGMANMALKYVNGETEGGSVVNEALFKNLDSDLLSEDQLELLHRATGYSAV